MTKSEKVVCKIPQNYQELIEYFAFIESEENSSTHRPDVDPLKVVIGAGRLKDHLIGAFNCVEEKTVTITNTDIIRHFLEEYLHATYTEYKIAKKLFENGANSDFVSNSTYFNEEVIEFLQDEVENHKEIAVECDSKILTPTNLGMRLARYITNTQDKEIELAKRMLENGASFDFVLNSTSLTGDLIKLLTEDIVEKNELKFKSNVIKKARILNPLRNYFPANALVASYKEMAVAKKMLTNGASTDLVLKTTSLNKGMIELLHSFDGTVLNEIFDKSLHDVPECGEPLECDFELLTPVKFGRHLATYMKETQSKETELAKQMLENGASFLFVLNSTSLSEDIIRFFKDDVAKKQALKIESELIKEADVSNPLHDQFSTRILNSSDKEIEIAKSMLSNGASKDFILKTTSLNEATVEELLA